VLKALAVFRGAIEVRNHVALQCYPWFERWYKTKDCYTLSQISLFFGSTESGCVSPSNPSIPDKIIFLPFQTNQNNTNCTDELCRELAVVSIVGRKILDCLICRPKASAGESLFFLEDAVAKLLAFLKFNKETKTDWNKKFCEIMPTSEQAAPANYDTGIWITEFCLNLLCQTPNNGWRSLLGIVSNGSSNKKCQKFEAKKFDYDTLRLNYLSTICSLVEQSYPSTFSRSIQPQPNFHEFESNSRYHDHEPFEEINNTSGFYNHITSAVNSNADCQPGETYDSDLEDDFGNEIYNSDGPENVRFWWQMVTWFASLFVIQAYGRFWKSGIMYINILSPRFWKGEALNTKNFNRE
jgi:hypothetical protein